MTATIKQYDALPHWKAIAQAVSDYDGCKPPTSFDATCDDAKFDIGEACACIAHDWGEYNLFTYLEEELQFGFRPGLTTDNLEPRGRLIYNALNERFGREYYGEKWDTMIAEGAEEARELPVWED